MFKSFANHLFPHEKRLTVRAYGLLVLFCLALFLPGFFTLPVMDRDEARFVQASRQMLQTGNLIDIRFQDEARNKKPVGIHWLQSAAVFVVKTVAGDDVMNKIWPYRLPSLMGAMLAVLLTAAIGCKLFNAEAGFAAAILLASTLLLNAEARLAKTDAMLLASILACQYVLAKSFMQTKPLKRKDFVLFWGALAAGFLIKGPMILLAPLGTLLTLKLFREDLSFFKKLNPLWGLPLALLIAAPWFILIALHTEGAFYKEAAGRDLMAKIWEVQSWRQNWGIALPGLYALIMPLTLWPASLPFLLAMPYIWASRHDRDVRFLLAWIIPVWLIFELTLTKLPHYVLPAYPALCLLAMRWVFSGVRETGRSFWNIACFVIFAGVSMFLAALPALLPIASEGTLFYFALSMATLAFGLSLTAVHLFRRKSAYAAPVDLGLAPLPAAGFAMMLALFGLMLPNLSHVFTTPQIMNHIPAHDGCKETKLATAGYAEPSLIFSAGAATQFLNVGERLAVEMKRDPCLIGVVEAEQKADFLAKAPQFGLVPQFIAAVDGFNYGAGKMVHLEIYRTAPTNP